MLYKKTYWLPLLRVPEEAQRRTIVAPTFANFQKVTDCRAFRQCGDPESRFILIAVGEHVEDGRVKSWLQRWMTGGIIYESRRYLFLGFTDTQVTSKKPKLIFFAEGRDWTVRSLLESFGDLRSVYKKSGYGKYAARLHLAFSGTVPSLNVADELVAEIPDIKAPDGSLHTDGIGMIRDSFAVEVCMFNNISFVTSAFQILRGGIKGVLVRYPDDVFDALVGRREDRPYHIAYRPSMLKFKGGPTELELVNISQPPRAAHLNIQLILLLATLGVRLEDFEHMLKKQLEAMAHIPTDRNCALQSIGYSYRPDPSDLGPVPEQDGWENWGQRLTHMLEAPQDLEEPYLRSQLLTFQRWQYKHLETKLHLQVKKACYVMGVIDELGVLEEDQVFLRLPQRAQDGRRSEYITGQVMITRMPCFTTGDVRKFNAVVCPELDHMTNCIVFSRKSSRSIPDMIASGSPFATADREPGSKYSPERMTFDAINTFTVYRGKGLLVCDRHNAWVEAAQATRTLAESPVAQDLAELNERALDMVKNGTHPANIELDLQRLTARYALIRKPKHGEGNPISVLRSEVRAEQARVEAMQQKQNVIYPVKPWSPHPSLDLEHEDSQLFAKYYWEARTVMTNYNAELRAATKRDELDAKTREREDVKHADIVKRSFVEQYFGGTTPTERAEERIRASAWYCYAYGARKVDFAWLGARYLNDICAEIAAS